MRVALDSNLLVLLVAGLTDRRLVGHRKRVREYVLEDFDHLLELLEHADGIVVTSHVLTETCNMLGQDEDKTTHRLRAKLAELVANTEERQAPAIDVVKTSYYHRLGMTDCGLLSLMNEQTVLLTADVGLYATAVNLDAKAMNFNHTRPTAWRL